MAYATAAAPVHFAVFPSLNPTTELVVCTPYSGIAEYQGTRATLEAEGVIPANMDWPEGFNDVRWEDGKRRYWLRRERPEGQKGPRRQFIDVDWWMFRCDPLTEKTVVTREIERKAKELAAYIRSNSREGQVESSRMWNRYWESKKDKAFQTFRTTLGIVEKRRGRPCKTTTTTQGASA